MKKGFTLIELVAVMGAVFAVMGIAIVLLIQIFDFQQTSSEYSDGVRAANRLAVDFRNDIHAYGKPEILAEGDTLLRWNTGTEVVDYMTQPGEFPDQRIIVRTVQKDGKKSIETYRLPDRMTLWFVEGKDADAGLIAMSLWTSPLGTEPPKLGDLNPFARTLPQSQVNPKYAGNWRTIIVRYGVRE